MKPRFNYFQAPDIDDSKNRHILFYCEWGDPQNKDILVCVHGLSRNSRDFDYIAHALSDKYRVICIDVAGRGKSEWLSDKSDYDYETYVSDVIKLFNHLGINKVDWLGTSMGGIIGMIIAAHYPNIIRKLVLNDVGAIIPGEAIARIINYVGSSHNFHNKSDAERKLRERLATFGINKDEHWKHVIKHSIIKKLNGKYTFAYDPQIIPAPKLLNKLQFLLAKIVPGKNKIGFPDVNLLDIWKKISCPVMALRGALSDVFTQDVAEQMQAHNKEFSIIEIENVGHAPMLMEDGQIAIIREWLVR